MSESFIALVERYTHTIAGIGIAFTAGIILMPGHSH